MKEKKDDRNRKHGLSADREKKRMMQYDYVLD